MTTIDTTVILDGEQTPVRVHYAKVPHEVRANPFHIASVVRLRPTEQAPFRNILSLCVMKRLESSQLSTILTEILETENLNGTAS